jgi:hypothetical protein
MEKLVFQVGDKVSVVEVKLAKGAWFVRVNGASQGWAPFSAFKKRGSAYSEC